MFGYREGNILYVENASQAEFKAIFGTANNFKGKLFNNVKPGQSDVFIYYTGHGAPNPESNEAYLVPVDCDPAQAARNGYSLKTLYDNLSRIRYKSLTVVIDASFSGDTETGMLLQDTSPVYIEEEDPLLKIKNAVVMTSAAGSQISSWYPEKGHSLFTYFLLRGLRGEADESGDNTVTLGELKNYVTDNVGSLARKLSSREQTPQIFGNPGQPLLNVR